MRLSVVTRITVVAAPCILYDLAQSLQSSLAVEIGSIAGDPLCSSPPLLLPSLLSPLFSAPWRLNAGNVRSRSADVKPLVAFHSLLPHVQVAHGAENQSDKESEKKTEREVEKDSQEEDRETSPEPETDEEAPEESHIDTEPEADPDVEDEEIQGEPSERGRLEERDGSERKHGSQEPLSEQVPGIQTILVELEVVSQSGMNPGPGREPVEVSDDSVPAASPQNGPSSEANKTTEGEGGLPAGAWGEPEMASDLDPNEESIARTEASDMSTVVPDQKFRKDYEPSPFLIDSVSLQFELDTDNTKVTSKIMLRRVEGTPPTDLELDGEDLELVSLFVNGNEITERKLTPETGGPEDSEGPGFFMQDDKLIITKATLPQEDNKPIEIKTTVTIHPKTNLKLMGLFVSGESLVTQCEAQGFRRITYFLDRPDVLAIYTVRLEADERKFPLLLSNGNKVEGNPVKDAPGRHYVIYHDPFPKPSYLFAILAGKLESIDGTYNTETGNTVDVHVYSEPGQLTKLGWALDSVRRSMKWDEDTFGRVYDLDVLNIGCVSDFNSGAMENKGLNIFNCNLLLASQQTTTDAEFERVLAVLAHEYFHNWTGNRVTIRDWFELTLKEGLTVFREQMFMAEIFSPVVQRVQNVATIISSQFLEDSGPMAHPIRPDSFVSMDNLYTTTVYEKGAEVVRMYRTLLGPENFRKGMDLFFERHDGHAATCDDFRAAMADANGVNFDQFGRWYSQAGTPRLEVLNTTYNAEDQSFEISFMQSTPPTPGQETKLPLVIPIRLGLIGKVSKQELVFPALILEMTEEHQTFKIRKVSEDCIPSILRGFSAPVKLIYPQQTLEDLVFLMAFDIDPVNKWQASHSIASEIILTRARQVTDNSNALFSPLPAPYIGGLRQILKQADLDNAMKALLLRLPQWSVLAQHLKPLDPDALYKAMRSLISDIVEVLGTEMLELYDQLTLPDGKPDLLTLEDFGRRRLRNTLLRFLSDSRDNEAAKRAYKQYDQAGCMTDKYAALIELANMQHPQRDLAFSTFYEESRGDPLLIDKWFKAQALSDLPNQVERVAALQKDAAFSFTNPNRMRSLLYVFATSNPVHFHRADGKGYEVIANAVLQVDKFNPILASRLAKVFMTWRNYDSERKKLMTSQLRRMQEDPKLSKSTREVVTKIIGADLRQVESD